MLNEALVMKKAISMSESGDVNSLRKLLLNEIFADFTIEQLLDLSSAIDIHSTSHSKENFAQFEWPSAFYCTLFQYLADNHLFLLSQVNGAAMGAKTAQDPTNHEVSKLKEERAELSSLSYRVHETEGGRKLFIIDYGQITNAIHTETSETWLKFVELYKGLAVRGVPLDMIINRKNQTGRLEEKYTLNHPVVKQFLGFWKDITTYAKERNRLPIPYIIVIEGGEELVIQQVDTLWMNKAMVKTPPRGSNIQSVDEAIQWLNSKDNIKALE